MKEATAFFLPKQNREGPQGIKVGRFSESTEVYPLGKADHEMWAGTEDKHSKETQNLILRHHGKTLGAHLPGQVGEVPQRRLCWGDGFCWVAACPRCHGGVKEH